MYRSGTVIALADFLEGIARIGGMPSEKQKPSPVQLQYPVIDGSLLFTRLVWLSNTTSPKEQENSLPEVLFPPEQGILVYQQYPH